MKLIYCINELYKYGGMGRVLTEKINYLAQKYNYKIIVITTEDKNKKLAYALDKNIEKIDLGIGYYNIKVKNRFLLKVIVFFKQREHLKVLNRIMIQKKPDLVISMGDSYTRYICNKININCPKILEVHFEKKSFLNIKMGLLNKILNLYKYFRGYKNIEKYDKFIVLTEEDREQWLKEEKIKNIEVIPNPLPFYPEKISDCENKTIISVGRLEDQKGYDELVEVWNKLFKKYPEWKLEIYGEGSLRGKLQKKIDELGMTNSLLLKGANKNIMDKYLKSSIYVMSSRYEGFGMVLVEAMACGLPVISFDCPCGPKDIIKDGEDGFLIRNRDLNEMANKLEFLIQNEEKRKNMGKKAHQNIARYSKDKVMLQWKNLFEELVDKKEK